MTDPKLTRRELQVVALVAEGYSNEEIGRELHLTTNTVKKYVFRIYDKLYDKYGIYNRVLLAKWYWFECLTKINLETTDKANRHAEHYGLKLLPKGFVCQ